MCMYNNREMPIGDQNGMVRRYECMAGYKYATSMQWSVMWYSETCWLQDGRHGRRSLPCWGKNRSQDLMDLRSRTSREQPRWQKRERWRTKRRRFGERTNRMEGKRSANTVKERKEEEEGQNKGSRFTTLNKAFNFCLLMRTYCVAAMSLRAANKIILEIIRRNDPFSWLRKIWSKNANKTLSAIL